MKDSIEMVKIVDPLVAVAKYHPLNIKMSPDGKYFVVATQRGNLKAKKTDYKLILYRFEQIQAFLNQEKANSTLPKSKLLSLVSVAHNEIAFQNITWLEDSKTLAFIGWFDSGVGETPGQVYKLNIESLEMKKLTNHPRNIINFALNTKSQQIIYAAPTIAHLNKDYDEASYLMGLKSILFLTNPNFEYPKTSRYYIQKLGQLNRPKSVGDIYQGNFPKNISLSPNGNMAIVLTSVKTPNKQWLEGYNYLKDSFYKPMFEKFDENTMLKREGIIRQLSLIDLSTGSIEPILNAPSGLWVGGMVDVHWLSDSNVILGNTALPLNVPSEKVRKKRSMTFSTIEYNLNTKTIKPIIYHAATRNRESHNSLLGRLHGLSIDSAGLLKIMQVDNRRERLSDQYFRKEDDRWVQVKESLGIKTSKKVTQLDISVHQALNISPELMARDIITGHERIFTDFNPQFRDLTFGKVEEYNWKDRSGRNWKGGLVYPPNFEKGQKYPLVIQTHGFSPHDFLIDGPYGVASAFAAQALANKNMMVLQMEDPTVPQDRKELFVFQDGFEAAIDDLTTKGLIDREKVGLIGWSSTGVDVMHMLLYSSYPILASTIADSYNTNLFSYAGYFGIPAPGMAHIEKMNVSFPWGKGLDKWVANDTSFHLDRLKTPLRYEQYATYGWVNWWLPYTILKRQQKPVEYYVFNDAAHALIKPEHRKASQQGNVDWFTFWLKGEEDPDPAKAEQYIHWRKLRIQQEKSTISATLARNHDKDKKTELLKECVEK